jgi:hypothetical protein
MLKKVGDSPRVDKKMENCISDILANPKFKAGNPHETRKVAAIKICKTSIQNYELAKKGK